MRILEVSEAFRPIRSHRNEHDHNYCTAEAFYDYVQTNRSIDTERTYIPIFWANCYHAQVDQTGYPFRAVPKLQEILDSLDPREQYFTVARCDEGIYERIPPNLFVFGSGEYADASIPLTSAVPHTRQEKTEWLASFLGCVHCGGPAPREKNVRPTQSVWSHYGVGSRIRSNLYDVFRGRADCFIQNIRNGSSLEAWDTMQQAMKASEFCLCPRGYAPTSFRLYEAMAFGSIPVYVSDEFITPYSEDVDWFSFCVLCYENEIEALPEKLRSISQRWKVKARALIANLYPTHFNLEGTCRQIVRYLEEERL